MNLVFKSTESNMRTRIINAALDLFANESFHAVSVPRIAEKAGVGVGSIYRMTESKVALADLVFEHCINLLAQAVFHPIELDNPTGEDVFNTYWQRTVDWLNDNPDSMRFMVLYRFVGPSDRKSGIRRLGALEELVDFSVKNNWMRPMSTDVAISVISGPLVVLTLDNRLTAENLAETGKAIWKAIRV